MRVAPEPMLRRLVRALFFPLDAGNAYAQLGIGGPYGIGGYGTGFSALDSFSSGPGMAYVYGKVRSPQEQRATLTLGAQITTLIGRETKVTLPYVLPVDVQATAGTARLRW
jgi:hypothetical protein